MMPSLRLFTTLSGLLLAAQLFGQVNTPNNTLRGRVLYQSSGNKPAKGVRVKEADSNGDYSKDNGDYRLVFQTKRNGAALALEVGPDTREGKKIELVNEKELKAAKLPAGDEELLDIIVCPAGQRDIAAQKYYRILRTTADRELERKKKEVEGLVAQKEKGYQKISDLSLKLDKMQEGLDSSKMREQALYIASINLDRASQMVKDAVRKIEEEDDVEGALVILNLQSLDAAYQEARARKKKINNAIFQIIEGYELKISLLEPQYKFEEASECYERIIKIYEKENYNEEDLGYYYFALGGSRLKNGEYAEALELFPVSIEIEENLFPVDSNYLAALYLFYGHAFRESFNLKPAIECYHKSISLLEQVADPADELLLQAYFDMSMCCAMASDHYESMKYQLMFLNKTREKTIKDSTLLAINYLLSAIIDTREADFVAAEEHIQLGLEIMEQEKGIKNPLKGPLSLLRAKIYLEKGDLEKSLAYAREGTEMYKQLFRETHPYIINGYNLLAWIYYESGVPDSALIYSEKALLIGEKELPENHPDLHTSYSNTALIYRELGRTQDALGMNLTAIEILESAEYHDSIALAGSYFNVAENYSELNNPEKALEYNLRSLAINEKILPADHRNLTWVYEHLAHDYYDLGDMEKSLEFNIKTMLAREKRLPPDHLDLANSYNVLSQIYSNLGDYQKQLEYAQKALSIREKVLPADHIDLAISYSNIGRAYRDVGEYKKGIEYGQKAIQIGERSNPEFPFLNRFYANLGITYVKKRQYAEARKALEKSEKLYPEERVYRGWAMYYMLQDNKINALESLRKAIVLGFKDPKWLETEPDLKNIRKEKGYKDLVEQLKKQ
ncbi:MAG: tetratricopeptide repeat protein [Saprospiraceae bacterium]|nr:tetratricopeptide repeat protein [Saprospiraceae bacterium]